MLPDSVPLISAAAVKAALAQRASASSASAPVTAAAETATTVTDMRVEQVRARPPGYLLTLSNGQQSLLAESELPLPTGTRLTLQWPAPATTAAAPAQLPLPATPGNSPLSAVVLSLTLPGDPDAWPAPEAALLSRFIAARLPLLQNPGSPGPAPELLYQRPSPVATPPAADAGVSGRSPSALLTLLQALTPASAAPAAHPGTTLTPTPPPNPALTAAPAHSGQPSLTAALSAGPGITAATPVIANATPGQPPEAVRQLLQQWQQQLPDVQQLSQPGGIRHSIQNSGLSYEQQLFSLLGRSSGSPAAALTPDSGPLFRTLWQRALAIPETGTAPATGSALSVSQILQQVKARLENTSSATSDAARSTETAVSQPPSLLQALLGRDHKAVLGRALLLWAQQLQTPADSHSSGPRSLPLLPFSEGPEAFRLLQSALAQTEQEQVQRLQQGSDQWQLQIPLYLRDGQHTREIALHLSKEPAGQEADGRPAVRWRLRLHFDLQQLGPLDVDIELQLPAVSATFWSLQPQTLHSLNQTLKPLRQRLQAMGVNVETLQARHGQLPEPARNRISQRLIDTHS